jgi:hypothetical protein
MNPLLDAFRASRASGWSEEPEVVRSDDGKHVLLRLKARSNPQSGMLMAATPEEALGFFFQTARDCLTETGESPPTFYICDATAKSDFLWTDFADQPPPPEHVRERAGTFLEEMRNASRFVVVYTDHKAGARGAASFQRRREVLVARLVDRGVVSLTRTAEVIRDDAGKVERFVDNPPGICFEVENRRWKALIS